MKFFSFRTLPLLLLSLVLTLLSNGCRGFEDGPLFSMTTVENRVKERWVPVEYTVDGVDKLYVIDSAYVNPISGPDYPLFDFTIDTPSTEANVIFNRTDWTGFWGLTNRNKNIEILFYNEVIPNAEWRIVRLTKDDFWLTTSIPSYGNDIILKMVNQVDYETP